MFTVEQLSQFMHIEWATSLLTMFNRPDVISTLRITRAEREHGYVYPPQDKVYRLLKYPPSHYKCLILGQSPYHYGVADGYAFSSAVDDYCPDSLSRIMDAIEEIDNNLYEAKWQTFSLERWVDQGVMLLNVLLTTNSTPLGHSKDNLLEIWKAKYSKIPSPCGWEPITAEIIKVVKPNLEAAALWGSFAHDYQHIINCPTILAEHPVAGLYRTPKRKWQHNNSFQFLNKHLKTPVIW